MIIGIINPKTDGNVVFANQGSVKVLTKYLEHEQNDTQEEGIFFNQNREGITATEVKNGIDQNVKGLRHDQEKFYSLYIAPSEKELQHIGNDDQALIRYTRKVMENYAFNFNLKDGGKLKAEDIRWYATIHQDRQVKFLDLVQPEALSPKEKSQVQKIIEGKSENSQSKIARIKKMAELRNANRLDPQLFQVGENKPGLNKHVHVVVSARDVEQKVMLNPRTRKSRFNIRNFQENSARDFQQMFHYQGKTIQEGFWKKMSERNKQYFAKKVNTVTEQVNQHIKAKLDPERLNKIGEKYNYSNTFFINLSKMKYKLLRGERMTDPYFYVAKGRDLKARDLQPQNAAKAPSLIQKSGFSQEKQDQGLSNQGQQKPVASTLSKLGKAVQQMSNAMLVNQSFFLDKEQEKLKSIRRRKFNDKDMEL